jgi:D-alanyl-D-alanine carboxypeptidase
MKTITDGMGMGLFQVPFGKKTGYGHNGLIDGFVSNLFHFPEDGVTVAVCSNGTSYALNNMVIALLSSYYNVPFELPVFTTIALKPEDLDKYTGIYSTTQLPIKITISKNNATLTAQATGQSSFPLEPTAADVFKFDQAGVIMEFFPSKNQLVLKQGGANFVFTRE